MYSAFSPHEQPSRKDAPHGAAQIILSAWLHTYIEEDTKEYLTCAYANKS